MAWRIEYYEQQDSTQPAEVFEDEVDRKYPKLAGKLARIAVALESSGPQLGGGLIEPCHGYSGLWEMRAIFGQTLGRELFAFDGQQIILLHGYIKRAGQQASAKDLAKAAHYLHEYQHTHRVSPEADAAATTSGDEEKGSIV